MIGKKLNHYEILELVGRGGMGVVYKAQDVRLGRPVALKVLREEITGDEDKKRRFLREARSASAVTHPAIAQIYDVDEADGILFIAMEFVEGQTVRQLIRDRELDLLGAVEIATQAAEGLGKAHSVSIVHRDVKSDNIIVTPDGHAKILDFGLAKLLDPGPGSSDSGSSNIETMAQTQAGTVLGTVAYMSPEQARGKSVDHRSDIFSLGIVLYEMVVGELPFKGQSPLDTMHAIAFDEVRPVTVIRQDLPAELQRVLSHCLRKRPEDRYQDTAALITDLKRLRESLETGSQRPVTFMERIEAGVEWVKFSVPYGIPGVVIGLLAIVLLIFLIVSEQEVGTLLVLLLFGLPVYRHIRNRKTRMTGKIVAKVSKLEPVKAIIVRGNLITIIAEEAKASLYIRVNSQLDAANKKLFYGEPLELVIKDDLDETSLQAMLREPGVRYLRENP
ncbi:MAG TPA: serine/threonine-protein kinase [Acidobacteriota bacterium]|nr:serine/threonine-protein kinase [Acidobacteriota bacterium]